MDKMNDVIALETEIAFLENIIPWEIQMRGDN